MKARLLELLRAHWPLVLALALGVGIGRFAHSVTTTRIVTESESTKATAAASGTTDSHLARGPVDIEVDVGGWAPPVLPVFPDTPQAAPSSPVRAAQPVALWRPQMGLIPDCLLPTLPPGSKIRIHEAPSTADTHASTQSVATEETHRELKEVLSAAPWREVAVHFDDPLGERRFRIEGGVRVLGPAWLRLGWKPADGVKGISPGFGFQW